MYALTGCDLVSFFSGFGKKMLLKIFTFNSSFICGTTSLPGSLAEEKPTDDGFLAFLRLVGSAYFKKVRSAFDTKETPHSYYLSLIKDPVDAQTQHEQWIAAIRDATWERTYFEESSVASLDALRYHFKRGLWTVNYWSQAISAEMNTLPVTECGWEVNGSQLQVKWDSAQNIAEVKKRVHYLLKGCNCKKSQCLNGRCKCYSNDICGPGCNCTDCKNIPQGTYHCILSLSIIHYTQRKLKLKL